VGWVASRHGSAIQCVPKPELGNESQADTYDGWFLELSGVAIGGVCVNIGFGDGPYLIPWSPSGVVDIGVRAGAEVQVALCRYWSSYEE